MTIEAKYGVPTVAMHTDKFDRLVRSVATVNGMAALRQVFVPQPIMGKSPAELRAYVDGRDPITSRPVMQEVVEGLTRPFDAAELKSVVFDRSTPRLCEPDTEENLHRVFLDNRWTDMLPIVLPTEERVAAMLAHTHRKPDEIVGHMRSTHFREYWEYTVEKVAVNAVMAGARPEYFPVILALAATGVTARSSSSSAMASMAVVNGPVRRAIDMNAGIGAMGPYNHANATIGSMSVHRFSRKTRWRFSSLSGSHSRGVDRSKTTDLSSAASNGRVRPSMTSCMTGRPVMGSLPST